MSFVQISNHYLRAKDPSLSAVQLNGYRRKMSFNPNEAFPRVFLNKASITRSVAKITFANASMKV